MNQRLSTEMESGVLMTLVHCHVSPQTSRPYMPANMKSVRTLRSTTSADLRRMATKANMRLDAKTLQNVLDALKKDGGLTSSESMRRSRSRERHERSDRGRHRSHSHSRTSRSRSRSRSRSMSSFYGCNSRQACSEEPRLADHYRWTFHAYRRQRLIATQGTRLNRSSKWTLHSDGERAYFERDDNHDKVLRRPADGVHDAVAPTNLKWFGSIHERLERRQEQANAGLTRADSPWLKVVDDEKNAIYLKNSGPATSPFTACLEVPCEGYYDEVEIESSDADLPLWQGKNGKCEPHSERD